MFVLCPSCAGPFRIPADQIAPLVQIACPHCEFRMILDFEAANEPSLAEPGQLFAQGFESAEAYFSVYSHVGPQADVTPRKVEAPTPARPVEVETPAVKAPPTSPAATPPASVQTPASTPVSAPPPAPTPVAAEPVSRGNKTIIQAPKRPASMDPRAGEAATAPSSSGPSMRVGGRAAEVEPVAEAKVSAVPPEPRIPPHTPPAATATSNPPAPSEPVAAAKVEDAASLSGSHPPTPKQEAISKPAEPEAKPVANPPQPTGSSNVVYIALVVVVIVAIAVVVYLNSKG
ncbi:hypothetical protein [Nannocystis sp. SCPEA4]|uniref:hypothetical protein n=1 Tax=Nannocystis sp. SCPEA4 TaxID=2996787 RepID=UPI00226EA5D9|nr:hypothetical protein [Nannocystis sp. SCPEA4]MCY1061853.1 hypothetical protein [Nannocystis sp. SCPEA4]